MEGALGLGGGGLFQERTMPDEDTNDDGNGVPVTAVKGGSYGAGGKTPKLYQPMWVAVAGSVGLRVQGRKWRRPLRPHGSLTQR